MADSDPAPRLDQTEAWVPADQDLGTTQAFSNILGLKQDEVQAECPAKQLGDFALLERLGEGGMGQVFRARQLSKDREVAVKVLTKHVSQRSGFLERFQREARLMGRLQHPNIVKYFAAGESQGWVYLAMELLSGGSVASLIKKEGKLPVPTAIRMAMQCCSALQYAHEQGLVHRDIKPDNLLLTGDGTVKLADLGLAKAADETELHLTGTGMGMGTPLYAAPEQTVDAKRADARSDLYSLGVVLYECLTGKLPFSATTLLELLKAKEKGMFPPASQINKALPASVDRILLKLLAKLPDHRYQSAADALQELEWSGLGS